MLVKEVDNTHAKRILSAFVQDVDTLALKPLTLGRSGAGLYTFQVSENSYVLRLFSPIDNEEDRKKEAHIMSLVGEENVAPKVCYTDPEFEGIIMELLPWKTVLPDLNKKTFAYFLRKVHAIKVENLPAKSHFVRAEEWLSIAKEKGTLFPPLFEELYEILGKIQKALKPVPPVLIHNDLIPLNIMTDGISFKLVDWPFAGMGDPFWDLIDFTTFLNFTDEESQDFIEKYLGRDITPDEWNRFILMRPVPFIVRSIGGFAFVDKVHSAQFYEDKCKEAISFKKLAEDLMHGKLNLPLPDVICTTLMEAKRLVDSPAFTKASKRL